MHKKRLAMDDVYSSVREMRPIVAPNLIFMSQLMDFDTSVLSTADTCTANTQNHIEQQQHHQPLHPQIADLVLGSSKLEADENANSKTAIEC